ncbi:telomerase reverse transcriptase [Coccidioides posadasii str. Silveira]|uniref:Telomerase reverse transcriptase n=1 Tax=Coccidioides posadasii (strain RMSCC 757 / Silveira) TaxID=443226 RepID=E9DGR2_COCPS|nr:telomerase reverse transcriptase [Coccidioides posadasii str. Silveira]
MGKKRKRPAHGAGQSNRPQKRPNTSPGPEAAGKPSSFEPTSSTSTTHPVLSLYYPRVVKLRSYILELLPPTSKSRRRKVASLGSQNGRVSNIAGSRRSTASQSQARNGDEADRSRAQGVAELLDTTLVGVLKQRDHADAHSRERDFAAFTQSQFRSSRLRCTKVCATSSQSEIVDFAILTLFKQKRAPYSRHTHLLCHGFQRASSHYAPNHEHGPGIVPQYPNKNVSMLKSFPWTDVLNLLGESCEEIMLHLLLDCGLFVSLNSNRGTYYQLSGVQLVELNLLSQEISEKKPADKGGNESAASHVRHALHSPRSIVFVRSRIFYARPALNAKGEAKLGLQHIHVLNRYPDCNDLKHTVHIMKYIFPRQFGLHNVFTSVVDSKQTAQSFKDYTLREEEMAMKKKTCPGKFSNENLNKLPKRLRGNLVGLIQKLQKRHQRCSYVELLRHYCPVEKSPPTEVQRSGPPLTDFATPIASVSAFCRATLQNLIPNDLFGTGDDGALNRDIVMRQVDGFIQLRRFESMSLHDVAQGLKITCVEWLKPPQRTDSADKLCLSDKQKRLEIFLEFIYYIFDSLLIPLIRSNFYVTESNVHRNRLFYFRHDVWKRLIEPSVRAAQSTVLRVRKKQRPGSCRETLGYGTLRMLPKRTGARPIVNLRKRAIVKSRWNGRIELGHSATRYLHLFSRCLIVKRLRSRGLSKRLLRLVDGLISENEYAETGKKFVSRAAPAVDFKSAYDFVVERAKQSTKRNTVFVDTGNQKRHEADDLLALLEQHVRNNLVKIGKKYFRQKNGIPQGSVVSSILCNFFYGEHERAELGFLGGDEESLLLRLIDDYLLITTKEDAATRFLRVMLEGGQEYGILVTPGKTLVNFEVEMGGYDIRRLGRLSQEQFPYCGNLIDTRTLAISKDRTRRQDDDLHVCDSLTLELRKTPGQGFYRKSLSMFKLQAHAMFFDVKHNSASVVLAGVYHAFLDCAMRMYAYLRSLSRRQRNSREVRRSSMDDMLTRTIGGLIDYAVRLIRSCTKSSGGDDGEGRSGSTGNNAIITRVQIQWLAVQAFREVLGKKQSRSGRTIQWLDSVGRASRPTGHREAGRLWRVVKDARGVMQNYRI